MKFFRRFFDPLNKQRSAFFNNQGIALAQQGLLDQAKEHFQKAIDAWPENPQPHINMCNVLTPEGRFAEAKEHIRLALRSNPDPKTQQDAYNNLGRVYLKQNKPREAIKAFDKCLEVYEPDFDICYNLAVTYEGLGEWEKAAEFIETALQYGSRPKVAGRLKPLLEGSYPDPGFRKLIETRRNARDCTERGVGNISEAITLQRTVKEKFDMGAARDPHLVFFIGSGMSLDYPSCLPTAGDILVEILYYLFKTDEAELKALWNETQPGVVETFVQKKIIAQSLENVPVPPFEPIFQALSDGFGQKVMRFVELLEGGNPNMNHMMLAHAIKNGHTVITTNFDRQIEKAWEECFPEKPLKVLIHDLDFQEAIESRKFGGVLAKIHGDLNDFNSLALTLEGIASSSDRSVQIGEGGNISIEMAAFQSAKVHPKTFLSPPKALFLQEAMDIGKTIVMGYSGMDKNDIMPILLSHEGKGIWINHEYNNTAVAHEWAAAQEGRAVLKPSDETEQGFNISRHVSLYFLKKWTDAAETTLVKKREAPPVLFQEALKEWVWRLRLRPGDGLAFWGKLYSQRGDWHTAAKCFEKAATIFEKDLENNEYRWLTTQFNQAAVIRLLQNKRTNTDRDTSSQKTQKNPGPFSINYDISSSKMKKNTFMTTCTGRCC
ncbi:MAG: tetratricopeptide repeat protein [Saprospiraceae bacterium]|nr:tetratricopeptide repeat protein [Saprospiraceae bacterium]